MSDYDLDFGYPSASDCVSFLAGLGIEIVKEYDPLHYEHKKQVVWGHVHAVGWAAALRVYAATATTFNVAGGKYNWRGTVKTYTAGANVDPTDDDTTYVWMKSDNSIDSGIDGDGWPSTVHEPLAEIDTDADGVITDIRDLRGESFLRYCNSDTQGQVTASGITTGPVACKRIGSAELKALLDTSTNNLFAVKAGDLVLRVVVCVKTAAGAACVVDVGFDEDADGSAADTDGWLEDANANAAGCYPSDAAGSDIGYSLCSGAYAKEGGRAADDDGYITITSSTDQSGSTFVGGAWMLYIPA